LAAGWKDLKISAEAGATGHGWGLSAKNLKFPQTRRIVADMVAGADLPASVGFGRFRVLPHRREMIADGKPIKLGGRAFDILMTLIEARGAVVSKDALKARVWPDRIVEENNLQSHISALRAALGPDRQLIHTVSGRGYQFIGEIQAWSDGDDERASLGPDQAASGALPSTNLPEPVSGLIGRDEELAEILNLVGTHRLVTLTGAGGIGKTTLALALARELRPHFPDGVWLAEFSALADPQLVPATVAAAVGLDLGVGEASAQRVVQALAGRCLLLVLDTCEHVIDAAAAIAEAALGACATLQIIITSREPLRAGGEWIYPVQPLAVPASYFPAEDDPLRYGAVRLFAERARATEPHFAPDRGAMATIASICRRLDGIPLAIELAAARAAALGIEELAARIDDRFRLLTGGRRTALARHQTLRATLDWSYALLAEPERVILARLSVFLGPFGLRAAGAVAADPELAPLQVVDGLSSLVSKSLVTAEFGGLVTRYRLLDTTRAYAREKLGESGERETLARHHAEYYRDVFERAEAEREARPAAEWLADYGPRIDNLRAALDWAFSPEGDPSIGVALTAAAGPLWMHLSLIEECRGRVEQALSIPVPAASLDARREMKLYAAFAASLMYIRGAGVPEVGAAWAKAFELAENLADTEFQLRSLRGLWAFHINSGRQREALQLAQRFCMPPVSSSIPFAKVLGEPMLGVSEHHLGDQPYARRRLEGVLAASLTSDHKHFVRFQIDSQVMARVFLARTLWLQGDADQAARIALNSAEEAGAANHANTLGYVLGLGTCLIALWRGDLDVADGYVRMLLDHSTRYGLSFWLAFGRCYQGQLVIRRGDVTTGLQMLRTGLSEFIEGNTTSRFIAAQMAEALGQAGRVEEGLALIEGAIERSQSDEELWATAELLRIKGELVRMPGIPETSAAAEDQFRQALELSRQQGALSWELRAATSLGQMLRDKGRSAEGLAILQPVYDRFTEGFDTTDLKAAKTLLAELA
jgi:predicted ATPase/DNA-binding winged helix-turn-helix (wHTH) protein